MTSKDEFTEDFRESFLRGVCKAWEMTEEDAAKWEALWKGKEDHDSYFACLYAIRKGLHGIFRDVSQERDWLHSENAMLSGRIPLSQIMTGNLEDLQLLLELVTEMSYCG